MMIMDITRKARRNMTETPLTITVLFTQLSREDLCRLQAAFDCYVLYALYTAESCRWSDGCGVQLREVSLISLSAS